MKILNYLIIIVMLSTLSIAQSENLGDANQDGQIRLNDVIYALQINSGIKTMNNSISEDFIKDETDLITTNRKPVGMDRNILFNATNRYKVTYSGEETYEVNGIDRLFDAYLGPLYQNQYSTKEKPFIITIDKIPAYHTQVGAWIGWTTRGLPPRRFKIEGYSVPVEGSPNPKGWLTLADHTSSDNFDCSFYTKVKPSSRYPTLRFTFYGSHHDSGEWYGYIGISELVYILPESARPYSGLLPSSMWEVGGKVGINIQNPSEMFDVKGNIKLTGNLMSDKGNIISVSNSGDICIGKCH